MRTLLLSLLFLAGCASKDAQLLDKGEDFLKQKLNDPSSYQRVEAKIKDTTTYAAYWTKWAAIDSLDYELAKIGGSEYAVKLKKETFEAAQKQRAEAKPGEIRHITMLYKFRSKNPMGALVLWEETLLFYPSENKFERP